MTTRQVWISLRAQRAMAISSLLAGHEFKGSTDISGDRVLITIDEEVYQWLWDRSGPVMDISETIIVHLGFEESEV